MIGPTDACMTYELLDSPGAASGKAIHCLLCGSVSPSPTDVVQRYCAKCQRFHQNELELAQAALITAVEHARPDLAAPAKFEMVSRLLGLLSPATTPPRFSC